MPRTTDFLKPGLFHFVMSTAAAIAVGGLSAVCVADEPPGSANSPGQEIVVNGARIKLKEHRELTSSRPGKIARVFVSRGDDVEKDSPLIQLDDKEVRARLKTAEKKASSDIETRYAEAAFLVAEADELAAKDANRRLPGTIPEAELRKLVLTAKRSKLQIEQAELQDAVSKLEVDEISAQLEAFQVLSPISGRVGEVHKQRGEGVQQGEVIVEVINTEVLLAEGYVSVNDAERIRRRTAITVTHRGVPYGGHIVDIDRQATLVGDRVKVFAEFKTTPLETGEGSSDPERVANRVLAGLKADFTIHVGRLVEKTEPENDEEQPTLTVE